MIRQARAYLAGAVSSTALVAAAVVAFVILVSFQALRDWPLAGLGGDGDASVSSGQPVGGSSDPEGAAGPVGGAGAGSASGDRARASGGGAAETNGGGGLPAGASQPNATPISGSPGSGQTGGVGETAGSGSGSVSGSGGGGSGGSGGGGGNSTSGSVAGTVNDTVSGVDSATGGALGETGVTKTTEDVVNGTAGPQSPVGETVDKTTDAVGGLLP